jgi:hypothetical protein
MTDITGAIAQEAAALRQQALDAVMSLRAERDALRERAEKAEGERADAECDAIEQRARAEAAEAKLARVAAVQRFDVIADRSTPAYKLKFATGPYMLASEVIAATQGES